MVSKGLEETPPVFFDYFCRIWGEKQVVEPRESMLLEELITA